MPMEIELQPARTNNVSKIVVVGSVATGKTALVRRFVDRVMPSSTKATIGVDFALKSVTRAGCTHVLKLWDVGAQALWSGAGIYYRHAVGALVVCDITRPESFDFAVRWKVDIDSKVLIGPEGTTKIPCILLVNKCDLGPLHMTTAELDAFSQQHGFVAWFLTSARTGVNVDESFGAIADCVPTTVVGSETLTEAQRLSVTSRGPMKRKDFSC